MLKASSRVEDENYYYYDCIYVDYMKFLCFSPGIKGFSEEVGTNRLKELLVFADRDILNIIPRNLLTNSIKYSSKGTIITINASADNEKIHVFVKDEGIGI